MDALPVVEKPRTIRVPGRSVCNTRRTCLRLARLAIAAIASVMTAASPFDWTNVNAQQWVPRNTVREENAEPIIDEMPLETLTPASPRSVLTAPPVPTSRPQPSVGPQAWPMTPASGPTHLVIQAPTPTKQNRSAHHSVPQVATPTYQESVGGGYWNQSPAIDPAIINHDEVMMGDDFGPAESPPAAAKKKKIDLSHAIPSHAHKTPPSIAIPDAHRTTGWKQPYSYGHFGAKHNRQWSVHHGHQRSYTQWTFR